MPIASISAAMSSSWNGLTYTFRLKASTGSSSNICGMRL